MGCKWKLFYGTPTHSQVLRVLGSLAQRFRCSLEYLASHVECLRSGYTLPSHPASCWHTFCCSVQISAGHAETGVEFELLASAWPSSAVVDIRSVSSVPPLLSLSASPKLKISEIFKKKKRDSRNGKHEHYIHMFYG